MATTFSSSLKFNKQGVNDNILTWGLVLNTNFDLIEDSLVGFSSITLIDGNNSLTQNTGAVDQSRMMTTYLTGALTTSATVIRPDVEGFGVVANFTTGNKQVTLRNNSGTGFVVPPSSAVIFYSDGASTRAASPFTSEDGTLILPSTLSTSNGIFNVITVNSVSASVGSFYNLRVASNCSLNSVYTFGGINGGGAVNASTYVNSPLGLFQHVTVNGIVSANSLYLSGGAAVAATITTPNLTAVRVVSSTSIYSFGEINTATYVAAGTGYYDRGSKVPRTAAWGIVTDTGVVLGSNNANIAAVSKTGTGNYRVTFTSALPDNTYAVFATPRDVSMLNLYVASASTVNLLLVGRNGSGTPIDGAFSFEVKVV